MTFVPFYYFHYDVSYRACKDNQDQAFADCSIPQEKSNAEINADLQISDEEDACDGKIGSKGSGHKQLVGLLHGFALCNINDPSNHRFADF